MRPSPPRIGLVLGAGGAVGHAFHAGVLAGLVDVTGWDARAAEVIVGTSAGSIVGALLRARISPADLAARSTGAPLSPEGGRLLARAESARAGMPRVPSRPARTGLPTMSSPLALARGMLQPWAVRPGALAAAALPEGRVPTELIAAGLRPLFDGWPERALWINAVALSTSRRVTFGRDGPVETDVATAVAASCAIPGFFTPVVINGARYIDGGAHSPTNADLVAGLDLDLVVISSPMSIARAGVRVARDQAPRRLARLALTREAARIRRHGTQVLTFQPTEADLAVMGWNAMDASRVAAVASCARSTAAQRLARKDAAARADTLRESARRP
jgi:NTE family protein